MLESKNTNELPQNAAIESKKTFTKSATPERKSIKELGFEQAGINKGDPIALEAYLRWIREGHLVDESYTEEERNRREEAIQAEILEKEKQKSDKEISIAHINETSIPSKEAEIKQKLEDINRKKIDLTEGKVKSQFNLSRYLIYVALTVFIGLYLIFFYASAINASFFRTMQQVVNQEEQNDIILMLNSIFDPKGIFEKGPKLIFIYLGAFIFFGCGLVPHIFFQKKSIRNVIYGIVALLICLLVDGLMAYKIDSAIHDLKIMIGQSDAEWVWFKSINFYMVLAFGFGTYALWGILYEAAIHEYQKKDNNARVETEIKNIKHEIKLLEQEILALKGVVTENKKIIEALFIEIKSLRDLLEKSLLKPEELKKNMENFFTGWLAYLNVGGNIEFKEKCDVVYKQFYQSLTISLN